MSASWSTEELKPVFVTGVVIELIPGTICMFLSDKYALKVPTKLQMNH